jgi:hypothetical protein
VPATTDRDTKVGFASNGNVTSPNQGHSQDTDNYYA